jgi:hypothetical protein
MAGEWFYFEAKEFVEKHNLPMAITEFLANKFENLVRATPMERYFSFLQLCEKHDELKNKYEKLKEEALAQQQAGTSVIVSEKLHVIGIKANDAAVGPTTAKKVERLWKQGRRK